MKVASPRPSCPDRYPARLLKPVQFDGTLIPAGGVVEVSDGQVALLLFNECAEAAIDVLESNPACIVVIAPRAVMQWAADSDSLRWRKKWKARNRIAAKGVTRLDAGANITEQIRGLVS